MEVRENIKGLFILFNTHDRAILSLQAKKGELSSIKASSQKKYVSGMFMN
jgi:hypothetical protein